MNTIDDFVELLRDEMGISVTVEDTASPLDQVVGWDSVYLLSLLAFLERRTGRELLLADVLEAQSLADIYHLAAAA